MVRRLFISVVLILALVGCTQTEGNWVLWTEEVAVPDNEWDPVGAWKTKAECEAEKTRHMDMKKNKFLKIAEKVIICAKEAPFSPEEETMCAFSKEDSMVVDFSGPGSTLIMNFVCLPELINPRKPG